MRQRGRSILERVGHEVRSGSRAHHAWGRNEGRPLDRRPSELARETGGRAHQGHASGLVGRSAGIPALPSQEASLSIRGETHERPAVEGHRRRQLAIGGTAGDGAGVVREVSRQHWLRGGDGSGSRPSPAESVRSAGATSVRAREWRQTHTRGQVRGTCRRRGVAGDSCVSDPVGIERSSPSQVLQ